MPKITFVKLEDWQEKNCLYCGDNAVQQAGTKENKNIAIRCCLKEDCKRQAETAAGEIVQKLRSMKKAAH